MWFQIDKVGFNATSAMCVMKYPFLSVTGFNLLAAFYTLLMPDFLTGSLLPFSNGSLSNHKLRTTGVSPWVKAFLSLSTSDAI
jgi:hypothetical protein